VRFGGGGIRFPGARVSVSLGVERIDRCEVGRGPVLVHPSQKLVPPIGVSNWSNDITSQDRHYTLLSVGVTRNKSNVCNCFATPCKTVFSPRAVLLETGGSRALTENVGGGVAGRNSTQKNVHDKKIHGNLEQTPVLPKTCGNTEVGGGAAAGVAQLDFANGRSHGAAG